MPKDNLGGVKPVVFSCEGRVMSAAETEFFARENPFGFILFARNIDTPDQVRQLIADFRQSVGRPEAPVLIDQEGGRVQRLRSPHWFEAPAAARIGEMYVRDKDAGARAAILSTQLIAADLASVGITVNCAPCLDMSRPETSSVIGNRAYSSDPAVIIELATIICNTYMQAGIIPVIKHIPGHGRATVDSHKQLPVVTEDISVLEQTDFVPFKVLSKMPWGMTAHIVFSAIDATAPATQSALVINQIIRQKIGFDGLLLSDDLNMNALNGSLHQRAEMSIAAGVDILLHCSGVLDEMRDVVAACPKMTAVTRRRIENTGLKIKLPSGRFDKEQARQELSELLM